MTIAKTPWAKFVTRQPERFGFAEQGSTLLMTAGARRTFCQLNLTTNEIRQGKGGGDGALVRPYDLKLEGWTSTSGPVLQAHPFVVPHLLATGKVDAQELRAHLALIGQGTIRVTVAIARPCELLYDMRLNSCALTLSTNCNLAWGQVRVR